MMQFLKSFKKSRKNNLFHWSFFYYIAIILLFSCNENEQPKPSGQVRLEYPSPSYEKYSGPFFKFEHSKYSNIHILKTPGWVNVNYPEMKANIYLTYYPISSKKDLIDKIKDSEKLVQEQTVKASFISPKEFHISDHLVFGTLYELGGESAINVNFHATDSTKNFMAGSVYFSTPPKPDSLAPAILYLKNDLKRLIETIEWKN